jgi:ABC-type transport system substrate-binding protein
VFSQLYVRQALAYLVDQAGMDKAIYRGYGYPTTGPAPTEPSNQWVPSAEDGQGPYPFSIAKATSLLTSHGWAKVNGVMTCTDPAKCGSVVWRNEARQQLSNLRVSDQPPPNYPRITSCYAVYFYHGKGRYVGADLGRGAGAAAPGGGTYW